MRIKYNLFQDREELIGALGEVCNALRLISPIIKTSEASQNLDSHLCTLEQFLLKMALRLNVDKSKKSLKPRRRKTDF